MLIYKSKTMITKLENELQSIMIDFSKTTNNAERKQLIQEYLLASGIRFVRQNIPNTGNKNYNICVPFGKSRNKMVVGAHVDVVEGSSGMNDNLSSHINTCYIGISADNRMIISVRHYDDTLFGTISGYAIQDIWEVKKFLSSYSQIELDSPNSYFEW